VCGQQTSARFQPFEVAIHAGFQVIPPLLAIRPEARGASHRVGPPDQVRGDPMAVQEHSHGAHEKTLVELNMLKVLKKSLYRRLEGLAPA
jgi:hypothetical protein